MTAHAVARRPRRAYRIGRSRTGLGLFATAPIAKGALIVEYRAQFWACPANLELLDKCESDLIPECKGLMGAAAMIQGIMDGECRVLTF